MEETLVKYVLGTVQMLLSHFYHLLSNEESNIDKLKFELDRLKAFLADASMIKNDHKDNRFRLLEEKIRSLVHEMEVVVELCVVQAAAEQHHNFIRRTFSWLNKHKIKLAGRVKSLREDAKSVLELSNNDFLMCPLGNTSDVISGKQKIRQVAKSGREKSLSKLSNRTDETSTPDRTEVFDKSNRPTTKDTSVRRQNARKRKVIHLKKEMESIVTTLTTVSENFEVLSVVGMAGLGKTTMAEMIFHSQQIRDVFPTVIWVKISQVFNKKNVCLTILEELGEKKLSHKTVDELSAIIRNRLRKGKFLIFLDDVWTVGAWKEIQDLLPIDSNKQGKVLMTTRDLKVAKRASTIEPHKLRFLSHDECWDLIQLEIFGNLDSCPSELVDIGKLIAEGCHQLPYKVVMIARILNEKYESAQDRIAEVKEEWKHVSRTVKSKLDNDDGSGSEEEAQNLRKTISFSYNTLSDDLKGCFIYLAVFPEGEEIPLWNLIRLLIAEGLINARERSCSLEEIAEHNCKDLINKSLLMVGKSKANGEIKTCRVHESVSNFCKTEAAKQGKLFQEIKLSDEGVFVPGVEQMQKCRCISIHSYVEKFLMIIMKKLGILEVRSFLSFSKEAIIWEKKHMSSFVKAFKFIRILHVKTAITFPKFPAELRLLKYVSLSIDGLTSIPKKLSMLCNLQTLEVNTSSPTIDFQANIWKLVTLRHIRTNVPITFTNLGGKGEGGEQLRSINRLSPQSCTPKLFSRVENLQELGIYGHLAKLSNSKCGLEKLVHLSKLKLVNGLSNEEAEQNPLPGLPQLNEFPPNITTLEVSGTHLNWEHMSTLGRVETLEVLKLEKNTFEGHRWDARGYCFRNLESLYLSDTDLTFWEAWSKSFPKLRKLVLKNCKQLQRVPDELVMGLDELHMEGVGKYAATCAMKVEKLIQQMQGHGPVKRRRFKLIITRGEGDHHYSFPNEHGCTPC